jgi:hypothetical protein
MPSTSIRYWTTAGPTSVVPTLEDSARARGARGWAGSKRFWAESRPTAPGQVSARTVAAAPPPFGGNSATGVTTTPPPPPPPTPTPAAKGGGSTGGIVAGAAGAAAVLVGVWLWWRGRSPRREDDREERAGSGGKEGAGNEGAAVLGGCRPPNPKPQTRNPTHDPGWDAHSRLLIHRCSQTSISHVA